MLQQDYEGALEVVVIDDSPESSQEQVEELMRHVPLRYIYTERLSIGAKRNLATRSTDAEVICVWDDDDAPRAVREIAPCG